MVFLVRESRHPLPDLVQMFNGGIGSLDSVSGAASCVSELDEVS